MTIRFFKEKSAGYAQLLSRKAADETLVPVARLPKSERPENPIVAELRKMKDAIAATGDRKAIDAFNGAMIAAKRGVVAPAQQFIAAYDETVRTATLSGLHNAMGKD